MTDFRSRLAVEALLVDIDLEMQFFGGFFHVPLLIEKLRLEAKHELNPKPSSLGMAFRRG